MIGRVASNFRAYGARCAVCLFFAFFVIATSAGIATASDNAYADSLVATARAKRLVDDRYWQILLHYRPDFLGTVRSLIDDPRFFLAPDGKVNPEAELDATLRGFFQEGGGNEAIRCRFPARYDWLREQLGIDERRLPPVTCTELDKAVAAADPQGAVLVFPAAHMNNPASMFGHTLLRIDNRYHSELLAYAVNYAAVTDETNGFAYAVKGIFGMYKGYYSILPYYDKVKEYNDMEHRDMWEYRLDLTPAETRRMVLHIWELRGIYSNYYFFDENCSYNLLFLLETARPSVHLTDRMGAWVIPSDTVRAVRAAGLISGVKYRPSQAARIRTISATLTDEERRLAMELAEGRANPATAKASVGTLDLAAELLQYRYARREVDKVEFNRLYLAILTRRSALGPAKADAYVITPPAQPEEGHRTMQAGIGGGIRKGRPFAEFSWRPAYHDLLDPSDGYLPGAQIDFLDTRLRYYPGEEELRLQRLHLVDIVSLSPWDPIFRPVSWKVAAGFDQELHRDGRDHLVFRLSTGGGFAASVGDRGIAYLIGDTDVMAGEQLNNGAALGFGASTGLLVDLLPGWKLHLSGKGIYYAAGDTHLSLKGELGQNVRLGRDQSIQLTVGGERAFGHSQLDTTVRWLYFF